MRELEFKVDDMVFLKVTPWKKSDSVSKKKGKLNPRYIGPFKILEMIGSVAYRLELLQDLEQIHNVFHVLMLRKCIPNPSHAPPVELKEDLSFEIQLVGIVDQELKELRNKVILMVKVL